MRIVVGRSDIRIPGTHEAVKAARRGEFVVVELTAGLNADDQAN